jgi:hypothetical protein
MSSTMASRWPTLINASITPEDVDAAGRLTTDAVERLIGEARAAYLRGCETFEVSAATAQRATIRGGQPLTGDAVTVSIGVVEGFPETFEMEARIRSDNGDIAADARCTVALRGGVTNAIRDELIARAHNARYMH